MINKEEMLNHIDKSIDSLKEDLKNYIDKSVEENKENNKFYKKFKSNKVFENKEDLYNINLDEIKLGDIVFGVVYGDDIEDERYPFKIIYKSEDKLILQGIKNINKKYNFVQACNLKWHVKLMVDGEVKTWMHSTIISKEIIDEYNLNLLLSKQNLAVGFFYWTESRYNFSNAWSVDFTGSIYSSNISNTHRALPYVIIDL